MRLSKRAEYGPRAMIDLVIAKSLDYEVVPLSVLAEAENLPIKFLEQIMIELHRAGFVATQRGSRAAITRPRSIAKSRSGI
ncbi:Rrf2 family transcriptional regulator [Pelagicoccus sp. SDUM812002]|uniref:Rrf2 family transcriptional regulator n=1 Tax=Pelagicoccus sp. SDUM812002 TaxID=3041266 RepID=UPI00280FCD17|nr:Rrf2 family transcriptional regulator [Pelagicoccus sp. SDUM812002]MDQ8186678.1 Rrf2 family transcriptional regulator [Pelagicoccus sp. SDUM812002]